jgi:hypothetical protein
MVPPVELHVTAVLEVPETVAVRSSLVSVVIVAVFGNTATEIGTVVAGVELEQALEIRTDANKMMPMRVECARRKHAGRDLKPGNSGSLSAFIH